MVPASTGRRAVRALVDTGLLLTVFAVTVHHGILFALGATVALMAVMTLMTGLTGASPGGLVTGTRRRRIASQGAVPGWAAAAYTGFVLLAAVPTGGVAVLVLWLTALRDGGRSWFDRMAGTVLISSRAVSTSLCTLLLDGEAVAVSGPLVLGRQPVPLESHPQARLVAVLRGDDSVSKTHLLVRPGADGVLMTDLGSTNGTYVEDSQGAHRLSPGQEEYVRRGRQAYLGDGVCVVR
ncbi:FHA domain-containing protein [Actinomyces sp. 2119]|nr:FHA domain-containing protein [Actinomyces sp. 2119]